MDTAIPDAGAPRHPTLAEATRFWLKLGFISFGGPAGQIAIMHQELVERRRWLSEGRFLHALNYCMLLPGPEACQLAIYTGWLLHGVRGGLVAGLLFFLPAFVLLSVLAGVYLAFGDLPAVKGVFDGIKPAVVAIVLFAAWRIGSRAIKNGLLATIAVLAFIGIFFLHIDFPWIIGAACLAGLVGGRLSPRHFSGGGGHGGKAGAHVPALIDDDTPPPAHARFTWARLARTVAASVGLWLLAMWLLRGEQALVDIGAFFTKAAFLTIGGAYAVLPYVYQGGVEEFGWLTGPQMMDGLALGETTPGPLIMIVTWVGYLGGVAKAAGAGPLASGWVGAAVATFFTFLPSFFFILAGGPAVEATRDEIAFTAPLTAITAAVVGVIVNLAAFFAWHAFWPHAGAQSPFGGGFDALAAGVALAAFVALWRYKADVMKVIAVCAALGLGLALVQ